MRHCCRPPSTCPGLRWAAWSADWSNGRPHRLRADRDIGPTTSTTVTVGFSGYNQPVSVTVPPASQVTNINGIVSSIKGAVSDVEHAVSSFTARI